MKFGVAAVVSLAFVAICHAGPLPIDFGVGLDLKPADVDQWKKEISIGGQKVQLGLGWKKDNTVSVGAKIVIADGQNIPITAAVAASSKLDDMKTAKIQVGTMAADKVSGIFYADASGPIQYKVNARLPITSEGSPISAVGGSLEGSGLKPATLIGGIAVGKEVIQAQLNLDDSLKPANFNIGVAADV